MSVKQIFNTSAELDYPTVLPTLDLDFANTKTLDPRITFTRSSGGSYVGADGLIKLAGVNEARFDHDPYTGESLGLLVEEARTNLCLRSEEFDNAYFDTPTGSTVVPNAAIAPNGTLTADFLQEDTSTGAHQRHRYGIYTMQSGAYYTSSAFVKPAGRTTVTFEYRDGIHTVFNLQTLTVSGGGSGNANLVASSITSLPNGWYRLTATSLGVGPYNSGFGVGLHNGTSRSYIGDGVSGAFVWGLQVENAAFPTSYIPTEASTRTRATDAASITGSNFSSWFNRNNGTLLCNAQNFNNEPSPPLILTATPYYQGPGGYKLGLNGFWSSVTQLNTDAWANGISLGGSQINVSETPAASATIRHSFAYSPTECRACVKQTLGTLGGSQCFQAAQGLNQLLLQQYFFTVSSRISRLTYWPKRLTNAQLITLTT